MNTIWIFVVAACLSASPAFSAEWNYENRDYWPYIPTSAIANNKCWGERQSPIDIDTSDVYDEVTAKDLVFHASYATPVAGTVTNSNYHTLKFELANCGTSTRTISGGLLNGKSYKFCQLHFHWGSHSDQGSEHTIDGKEYPMEMHMVHIPNINGVNNVGDATNANGGILVTSFLFHVGMTNNPLLNVFTQAITTIRGQSSAGGASGQGGTGSTGEAKDVDLLEFYDALKPDVYPHSVAYYTYEGSLTTPPCSELVTFIVFERTISISEAQLDVFRTNLVYEDASPMVDNYRHPQPIENRIVKRVLFNDNHVTIAP